MTISKAASRSRRALAVCVGGVSVAVLLLGRAQAVPPKTIKPMLLEQLTFDPGQPQQQIDGFGVGFSPETYTALFDTPANINAQQRNDVYDWLYGQDDVIPSLGGPGLGLNIVRVLISSDAVDTTTCQQTDWANDPGTGHIWTAVAAALAKNTASLIDAVPFSPPACWKDPSTSLNGGVLPSANYVPYANYLASFVKYYSTGTPKHNIDVLSLQNEPNYPHPGKPANHPSCTWTGAELTDFQKKLSAALASAGLSSVPKLMFPEGSTWPATEQLLGEAVNHDANALSSFGYLASHSYPAQTTLDSSTDASRGAVANRVAAAGSPGHVWVGEMSLIEADDRTMTAGMTIAQVIHHDLVLGQASAWIYCFPIWLVDKPGDKVRGGLGVLSPIIPAAHGPYQTLQSPPKRFWTMAQYSHFVKPGWSLITTTKSSLFDNANAAAFVSPARDQFVIVALNTDGNLSISESFNFGTWRIDVGGDVASYTTSDDPSVNCSANVVPVEMEGQNQFGAVLPPNTVTTFVGHLAAPTKYRLPQQVPAGEQPPQSTKPQK